MTLAVNIAQIGSNNTTFRNRIMEDGNVLTKTYHRSSLTPGQDLTGIPANVVAICNVAWTTEVIAAYQAQVETNSVIGV